LWSVYVDQEVKQGNADKARNLLERALTVGLKKKGVISLLKKYLQVEKSFGSEQSVQKIIQRAKGLATSYETLEEDD
jgi:rRNA biogenesis protein RRP5